MVKAFLKSLPGLIFLSVLIHLFFFEGMNVVYLFQNTKTQNPNKPIEIVVLPPQSAQKPKQVVEQDKNRINDETPDKDYYLGRHNQRVVKQTRARKTGDYKNNSRPGQKVAGTQKNASQSKKHGKKNPSKSGLPTLKDLAPKFNAMADYGSYQATTPGEENKTNDHLKDLETGPQTLLSTREFIYYSYYQRIRDKIRQRWEPIIKKKVQRVFEQGRTIASARDRVTKVLIILNDGGRLVQVQVVGQSGVHDLDEAAIEAFKEAEPFPNPPDGIIESDGKIRISWSFILEA